MLSAFQGEADWPQIFPAPLPIVIEALQTYPTWDQLLHHLPDIPQLPNQAGAG